MGQGKTDFRLEVTPGEVGPGGQFEATLEARIDPGWHLYSMSQPPGGPIPTTIAVVEDSVFVQEGSVSQPEPLTWFDQNFGIQTEYFEGTVDFQLPVRVRPTAPSGSHPLAAKIRFMLCSDTLCLPPQNKIITTEVAVLASGTAPVTVVEPGAGLPPVQQGATAASQVDGGGGTGPQGSLIASQPAVEPAVTTNGQEDQNGIPTSTLAYIWFSMAMGGLALLTPCVFPMIPITVSYFTKREVGRKQAVAEAAMYAAGIVLTFTLIGFGLTFLFGAGGINRLAASPFVNILIALIFTVFALNLFGVLEISVPSSWINAINRKSSSSSGILGIVLMAFTFSLTSFTCTVPFVGTVMVAALQGDLLWSLVGVTVFATVFASPFFLLAVFPSWLQSLPKSGNWMNSMKVVMGFLELAAALKFFSNVDLVYQWELLTRPIFITVWLSIALVTSAYLLGRFRFPHEAATESVGAMRVLSAIFFLATSFYLLRGLFGLPLGELDAFLPPKDYGNVTSLSLFEGGSRGEEAEWLEDYQAGLAVAGEKNQPVFIDFTGYLCTNCRWMESNIFPLPEVRQLFSEFVLVRLYTDGNQPEHEANLLFEEKRFGTIALPLYAIMSPQDEIIATFPGLTRDRDEFVQFLRRGVPAQLSTRAGYQVP